MSRRQEEQQKQRMVHRGNKRNNSWKKKNVDCVRGYEKLSKINFGKFVPEIKKILSKENRFLKILSMTS